MKDFSVSHAFSNGLPHPQSAAINSTTPTTKDGTEFIKNGINEMWGFDQALLYAADLTPDGNTEVYTASQKLEAIRYLINNNLQNARPDGANFRYVADGEAFSFKLNELTKKMELYYAATGLAGDLINGTGSWSGPSLIIDILTGEISFPDTDISVKKYIQNIIANFWFTRTGAADSSWNGVTYGNGLFVAVSQTGVGNRVMTSPDGINWTIRTSAADNQWTGVTYGNALFVAVSQTGVGNRVMTSPDGINWTIRTSAADNQWTGVTYGNALFVAVAGTGIGNRVMTSPDGINWTIRTSAADEFWGGLTYGNGLFVATAASGVGNRVMTSPDGINWIIRTSAADSSWADVTYGNGLFVAVAASGSNRVMTSPDGINWIIRTSAVTSGWQGIAYGNNIFVAVASGTQVLTTQAIT